jgi:hypothetical protein
MQKAKLNAQMNAKQNAECGVCAPLSFAVAS